MMHDPDRTAPTDWIDLINDRCDLDLAFDALEGWEHFHTDTNRGRIRSLQFRSPEAWEYFRKAEEKSRKFEGTLKNVIRRFYLKVYSFENALMDESLPGKGDPGRTEACIEEILNWDHAISVGGHQLQMFCHGLYLLHQEEHLRAKEIFLDLLRENDSRVCDERPGFYISLAVAHWGLGEGAESDRHLENTGLCIPTLKNTFNMGHYAGILGAILRLRGRTQEAEEWEQFIVRIKIPEKTARLFAERSRRILERSTNLSRVFLF